MCLFAGCPEELSPEFLDGLVSKVYEFGGGKVREHLGGVYDWLRDSNQKLEVRGERIEVNAEKAAPQNNSLTPQSSSLTSKESYAAHKEQQKRIRKAEKAIEESERKISDMERRLKELDELLMVPENASDMQLVTEYTTTKQALDKEVEHWEKLSEELEDITQY